MARARNPEFQRLEDRVGSAFVARFDNAAPPSARPAALPHTAPAVMALEPPFMAADPRVAAVPLVAAPNLGIGEAVRGGRTPPA